MRPSEIEQKRKADEAKLRLPRFVRPKRHGRRKPTLLRRG
jgi:hypothetical protein